MTTIMIESSNGQPHEVELEAVKYSGTMKEMLDVLGESDEIISIPVIPEHILVPIIEWLNYCYINSLPMITTDINEDLLTWKETYFQQDPKLLIELLNAANYLNIQTLLDEISKFLAGIIAKKTPEAIRAEFGITDDLTKEQKEEIRKENELYGVPQM